MPYTLVLVDGNGVLHAYETSASSVDLGYDLLGRSDVSPATLSTPVTVSVSGLSAWISGDEVQLVSGSADEWDRPISGSDVAADQLSGSKVEDWSASAVGRALNLLTAADDVVLYQLTAQTATHGTPPDPVTAYSFVAAVSFASTLALPPSASVTPLPMTNGSAATITGTLSPVTSTGTLPVSWDTSQFESYLAAMGPGAIAATNPHALLVHANAYPLQSPAPLARGGRAELFRTVQPSGAGSVIFDQAATYGQFLAPALWYESRDVSFTANVSYSVSGATPWIATPSIGRREPMSPTPPSPIVPAVSPAQNPTVTTGTLTPTISWTAPALGVPTSYGVAIYQLSPSSGATVAARVASWALTGTSFTVPSSLLASGQTYYVEITAFIRSPEQFDTAPERTSNTGNYATALTSPFTTP
jgi:hypothetical protein